MKCTIAIAATLAALAAFAQGPTSKQILDITQKIVEIEDLTKGDESGIARAYLESQYRLAASGGRDEIETAVTSAILDFSIAHDKTKSKASVETIKAKIESDKSLRNVIASSDNVLKACCETIAAGGNANVSAIKKATEARKSALAKRKSLWSAN